MRATSLAASFSLISFKSGPSDSRFSIKLCAQPRDIIPRVRDDRSAKDVAVCAGFSGPCTPGRQNSHLNFFPQKRSIYAFAKLALTNFFDLSNIRSVSWGTAAMPGTSRCADVIFAQKILNEAVSRTARSTSDSSSSLRLAERLHTRLGRISFRNAQVSFSAIE